LQPLLISDFTAVNALGSGKSALVSALRAGRSGLRPCDFETVTLITYIGRVAGLEAAPVRADMAAYDCRNNRLAQMTLEQDGFAASVAARRKKYGAHRIAVLLGTSTSGILETELAYRQRDADTGALPAGFHYAERQNTYSVADFVRRYLELGGPSFVVSSACSSTAKVFGSAARMIEAGICDAAVVGGVDSLALSTLYGFKSLGLSAPEACRPYDAERAGISIGEGGGFVLLERADTVGPGVYLYGIGESADAHHMSTPHPQGLGARLAMEGALASAGWKPEDVDYINLHGTGTPSNDASEDQAVYGLFQSRTPCNSTKGATGHLLGASGVTEAIVSLLAMQNGFIPGSPGTRQLDPALKSAYVLAPREARIRRALSNSFGFGGSNCSLALGVGS
jgi:3-oxoacyl-[acyl-carrier-protein] synthase-1